MSYIQLLVAHWADGLFWLFWNIFAMLGLWGTGLTIFYFLETPSWFELVDKGQFLLYSVGFLGQAMFILTKEYKITTIPHRRTLVCFTVFCFAICILLFVGVVLSSFNDGTGNGGNLVLLRYTGFSILIFSMSVGFLVTIAAEARDSVDIPSLGETGVQRLKDQIPEQ